MSAVIDTAYAAIRTTDGKEWIDTHTISCVADDAWARAWAMDNKIAGWTYNHPMVRIALIELREVRPSPLAWLGH